MDIGEVRPLDVLLSLAKGWESKGIAAGTTGPYSHAAIAISRTIRFESVDKGVTFTPVVLAGVRVGETEPSLFESRRGYVRCHVYRHPGLAEMSEAQKADLQARLIHYTSRFNFRAYPPLAAFEELFRQNFPFAESAHQKIFQWLLKRLRDKPDPFAGPFCSQLIAELFNLLKLPLFDAAIHTDAISPTKLAHSELRRVKVVESRKLPPVTNAEQAELARSVFNRMPGHLSRGLSTYEFFATKLRQVNDLSNKVQVEIDRLGPITAEAAGIANQATNAVAASFLNIQRLDLGLVQTAIQRERQLPVNFASSPATAGLSVQIAREDTPEISRCLQPLFDYANQFDIDPRRPR
jgi:hypothetical protein